jgi:hypothetical protein
VQLLREFVVRRDLVVRVDLLLQAIDRLEKCAPALEESRELRSPVARGRGRGSPCRSDCRT